MDLDKIPLLAVIKSRMGYVNQRQHLISENVANANTPNYAPHDLKAFTFEAALKAPSSRPSSTTPRR